MIKNYSQNFFRYFLLLHKKDKISNEDKKINILSASIELNLSQINNNRGKTNISDFNEAFMTTSSSIPQRDDSKIAQNQEKFAKS